MKGGTAGVKELALYVLRAAALDIQSGGKEAGRCINEIKAGGIDLYLDLLGVDLTPIEFILLAEKGGKKSVQMSQLRPRL